MYLLSASAKGRWVVWATEQLGASVLLTEPEQRLAFCSPGVAALCPLEERPLRGKQCT